MIMTGEMIIEQFYSKERYSNPRMKLSRDVKAGRFKRLKRDLYETDHSTPNYALAQVIYGPSYISFDYALSFYGMIPVFAYNVTSATCNKHKDKSFITDNCAFYYSDVPANVFPEEVITMDIQGHRFNIASGEKALCDKLYKISPVTKIDEFEELLLDDIRLDEVILSELDRDTIEHLNGMYRCRNVNMLNKYLKRMAIS